MDKVHSTNYNYSNTLGARWLILVWLQPFIQIVFMYAQTNINIGIIYKDFHFVNDLLGAKVKLLAKYQKFILRYIGQLISRCRNNATIFTDKFLIEEECILYPFFKSKEKFHKKSSTYVVLNRADTFSLFCSMIRRQKGRWTNNMITDTQIESECTENLTRLSLL